MNGHQFSRGSLWNKWDLHFHTPSSFDYQDKGITDQQIVDRLVKENVRVVAVTDHHTMDVARIKNLQQLGKDKLTVLPGIELKSDQGGEPIHYICIFSEGCDLTHVWTTLQGRLGLTTTGISEKGGYQRVYVPIENGAAVCQELGGVVSIHAGEKSNSIESIRNKEQFQQRIKYDITNKWVDLMEVGQIKDIDVHLKIIFPATGLDKPLLVCSDNHDIKNYAAKAPLWLRADPTFRGLLMTIREPRSRVFIGDRPPETIRIEQSPTKYIRSISFLRRTTAPSSEQWFTSEVEFNPGLVAIVGNKGSGKSALSDILGLLGSTKNSESFSFLSKERFRHPTGGLASHFDATLQWHSGDPITRNLNDIIQPEEVERIKYLPQDHVESVCNELIGLGEQGFEQELKSVIFSHVPDSQRLGFTTLDELIRFQTDEKQKRIDSLIKKLREISRNRATLEAQSDPAMKWEIEEKIKQRESELNAIDKAKPPAKPNPSTSPASQTGDTGLLRDLSSAEEEKRELIERINEVTRTLGREERRLALAKRSLEKLDNFQKEFDSFKLSFAEDAKELGIVIEEAMTLSIDKTKVIAIRDEATANILEAKTALDLNQPKSLRKQLLAIDESIASFQTKLDEPNRIYQAYLKDLGDWQTKRQQIEGDEVVPDSLKGLKASLSALAQLPSSIEALRKQHVDIGLQILTEKLAQAEMYRSLYGPVQNFIDSHDIAKNKLKLEFRAELTNEGFAERFLSLLSRNRRGSFMGIDEGFKRVDEMLQSTRWEAPSSVQSFVEAVDRALHSDVRETPPPPTQMKDQLAKLKKPQEVFDLLYGLEYVRPRYILRWEGKDLSMLSPGERGTLLLVFYLLIDKGDMPLIIDQPEGNLDNHTVAKVLVDCLKEARKNRQVFIVTHNPNLAVVCDADQIVHASLDIANRNTVTYVSGALENPAMGTYITDVLEGTRWAFDVRGSKYDVASRK